MSDLASCELCEWRCGVNRLAGERGVCRVGLPEIATLSCGFALKSMSVTLLGCCYRCLHCNAYRISQYPDPRWWYGRHISPEKLVSDTLDRRAACDDIPIRTISFTGGDPIIHLPYIEEVGEIVKKQGLDFGIGLATGGYATEKSMQRIVDLCNTITLEIKAFEDDVHRAVTGAPVEPVLRNAGFIAKKAREKIRVFRTVVIPGITDRQVAKIAEYIVSLDPEIPYRLIGFRPNFVLYYHPGPEKTLMEKLTEKCKKIGLKDVSWSGYYPKEIPPAINDVAVNIASRYKGNPEASLSAAYANDLGCPTHPRDCGICPLRNHCPTTLKEPWNRR